MTLHKTVEFTRKFLIGILLGVAAIFIFTLIFRLGVVVKNLLFPPKAIPANHQYGVLPAISFPKNTVSTSFSYSLNTVTGDLPDFPDRINIYPIQQAQPSFLNLDNTKKKVKELDFTNNDGKILPEIALDNVNYEWREDEGIRRTIIFNTVTFNFTLKSSYLSSLTVLEAKQISNEDRAIKTVEDFLNSIEQMPDDVDKEKSATKLFSITNGELITTTSLSKTQVIKVDLHQKDIVYDLDTGIPDVKGGTKKTKMSLSVVYPHPPSSTMSFWVASGQSKQQVVAADFKHQLINFDSDINATYDIKTTTEAFEELKNGKGYIAMLDKSKTEIAINKVYLAYYLGETPQEYLMPVFVFEGEDGFVAYVSGIKNEWVK